MRDATVRAGAETIRAWRCGDGRAPRAHLQAGVHADEIPPMLVLHHLLPLLAQVEAQGRLLGTVTLVPQANPIGLRQFSGGRLLGRFDAATGRNFNRAVPQFAWQQALLAMTEDADIVLDLHTDDEALPYVYVHRAFWPQAADVAACLAATVAILWDGDGGGAFEDAAVRRWHGRAGLGGRLAATLELRGQADVDDARAQADARGLLRLLGARGVIAGEPPPPVWTGEVIPIGNMQTIRAPAAGILVFSRALGDPVAAGAAFARLVPWPGQPEADILLPAQNAGRLLTRARDRFAAQGTIVAKLTGDVPFSGGGDGPLDD